MAAALTLTIDRWRLTCLIVSFVLAKSAMSLDIANKFTTRHNVSIRQLRKRGQDNCTESQTLKKLTDQNDRNAVHEMVGQLKHTAQAWCMTKPKCTGYVFKGGKIFYSTSTNRSLVNDSGALTFLFFRCPISFRCSDSPCNNGGTCVPPSMSGHNSLRCRCPPQWTGWYCERLKSCADEPCELGETCRNSTTAGFICTSNVTSTTTSVTNTTTIVTNTTKTMDGGGLSTDTKIVIAAAAVGGVVVTGAAAAAVVSATSSAAATTTAGATGGQ